MASLIPIMDNIDWWSVMGQSVYWLGIILGSVLILGTFIVAYYFMQFRIKVTEFPLYGSGKDGIFSVGIKKKNRVKWINNRTAWRKMFPLFNKRELEPFDSEFIYPGKGKTEEIYAFTINDEWTPGRINIDKSEDELRPEINPVPYYIRNWQSLTHNKLAEEFAKPGFWEENKYLFITLGVTALNVILCGTVIWLTYKYAAGGREDAQMITQAIRGFANIAGQGGIPG